jgi:site-specific recombinase XerC
MSDDELVAAIDKYLTHESLVKSRRDAFHVVRNDEEISTENISHLCKEYAVTQKHANTVLSVGHRALESA